MLSIDFLAGYPQYIPVVAKWLHSEWGHHNPDKTVQDYEESVRRHLGKDSIPLMLIALWDGLPAGTASIYVQDMEHSPRAVSLAGCPCMSPPITAIRALGQNWSARSKKSPATCA